MDAGPGASTEARKSRHIDICLEEDVASTLDAGFSRVRLRHEALPEFALEDIDASSRFLDRTLKAPVLISSMTGGTQRAGLVNRNLACAAERAGIALALGSQRAALENPALLETYRVRDLAPTVLLFANLGAVQLNYGVTAQHARDAVNAVGADALYLHLNPLQEALQPHGDTNFRDLLPKIGAVVEHVGVPVVVKSVGSGIAVATARRLLGVGVTAIDVAGAGGTSWARVEGRRAGDERRYQLAETFAGWGYPTAEATRALRSALPGTPLVASGGLRSGVDVAKAIALGANLCGIAQPFLEPATRSADAVAEAIEHIVTGLHIAMFASGCRTLSDLPDALVTA